MILNNWKKIEMKNAVSDWMEIKSFNGIRGKMSEVNWINLN